MATEKIRFDGKTADGSPASVLVDVVDGKLASMTVGADGNPISSFFDPDNGEYYLNIHNTDAHHEIINKDLVQSTAVATTIATETVVNDTSIIVADTAGFAVGNHVLIDTTAEETTLPRITAITPGTPGTLTLDRRLDVIHVVGDSVTKVVVNIKTPAGTLATPQIFSAAPRAGEIWHITHISVSMGMGSAGDFGLFGNLTALTNGVNLRILRDGVYSTLTDWKTNGDINTDTSDVKFYTRSGGGGTHGLASAGDFIGITGAVIRLDGNTGDKFEVYVQDDLTALVFFYMKLQGHFEI